MMRSTFQAEMVSQDQPNGTTNAGRWRVNAGGPIAQHMPDRTDREDGLVLVIPDLATIRPARSRLPTIDEHFGDDVGVWDDWAVIPEGPDRGVYLSLTLYEPTDDREADLSLMAAQRWLSLIRRDHPVEASIGEDSRQPATYELVPAGESVVVNGEEFTAPADGPPLFVARDMTVGEASLVRFGADHQTGRMAARLAATLTTRPTRTTTMAKSEKGEQGNQETQNSAQSHTPQPDEEDENMQATLKAAMAKHSEKHHGLIARLALKGKDETAIDREIAEVEQTELQAELEALKAENSELRSQLEAASDGEMEEKEEEGATMASASGQTASSGVKASAKRPANAGGGDAPTDPAPKSVIEARRVLKAEQPTLKGRALQAAVYQRWPSLRG